MNSFSILRNKCQVYIFPAGFFKKEQKNHNIHVYKNYIRYPVITIVIKLSSRHTRSVTEEWRWSTLVEINFSFNTALIPSKRVQDYCIFISIGSIFNKCFKCVKIVSIQTGL